MRKDWECEVIGTGKTAYHRIRRMAAQSFSKSRIHFAYEGAGLGSLQAMDLSSSAKQYGAMRGEDAVFRPYILYGNATDTLLLGLLSTNDLPHLESRSVLTVNMALHSLEAALKQMEKVFLVTTPSVVILSTISAVNFIWDNMDMHGFT